jgi:pimeloyl-ACP methyl ester carboxylesterase
MCKKILSFIIFFCLISKVNLLVYGQINEFVTVKFESPEEIKITADFYVTEDSASAPLILLFHQYRSSRGEYREIAPVLTYMGFNCLAVDTRCGSTDRWNNIQNETSSNSDDLDRNFVAAYPDIVAALNYGIEDIKSDKIILWGSSFSSALIFKLAYENKKNIIGLLSFSPGEYMYEKGIVADWASQVKDIPVFITCGAGETETSKVIYNAVATQNKEFYLPNQGEHGSSILIDDARNWQPVKKFLEKFLNF